MSGFTFSERMAGTYTRPGSHEAHSIEITGTARVVSLRQHLRTQKATFAGRIKMEAVAADAAFSGELTLSPLFGHFIRYDLDFTSDEGEHFLFRGQKNYKLQDLKSSMATLPATIEKSDGTLFAEAVLTFDWRELPAFLGSFRPLI